MVVSTQYVRTHSSINAATTSTRIERIKLCILSDIRCGIISLILWKELKAMMKKCLHFCKGSVIFFPFTTTCSVMTTQPHIRLEDTHIRLDCRWRKNPIDTTTCKRFFENEDNCAIFKF